ncbi:MAG: hypothetical protein KDK27_03560 [Leptospiraceae bacterium]|nr:hypothetical protein [Leptospiraceae bacterium]
MGIISPVGIGIRDFWKSLKTGKTGLGPITLFDADSLPNRIAAEVKDWDHRRTAHLDPAQCKHFSRATQFGVAAARLAMADAGLVSLDQDRTEVLLGTTTNSLDESNPVQEPITIPDSEYPGDGSPRINLKSFLGTPAAAIALDFGINGLTTVITDADYSAFSAVGLAAQRIESGRADLILCGATETPINSFTISAMCEADLLTRNRNAHDAIRPFDNRHDRCALGEGAVIFVLESHKHARQRNARIYARIEEFVPAPTILYSFDFKNNCSENWAQTILDTERACSPDVIHAHGSGHRDMDNMEARALHQAYGNQIGAIPVTSVKAAVGSGSAIGGAFQIAASALMIDRQCILLTRNHDRPAPGYHLNVVRRLTRKRIESISQYAYARNGAHTGMLLTGVRT